VKIAVVHHSLEAIEALEAAIRAQGEHDCVWVAVQGRGIAARCLAHPPDLLLVDVTLKNPSAVEITRAVLEAKACGVALVGGRPGSSSSAAYEAMGAGALDVLPLPGQDGGDPGDATLLSSRLSKLGRTLIPKGPLRGRTPTAQARIPTPIGLSLNHTPELVRPVSAVKLVAIGASTGGPQAIHELLASLPRPVTCSIVIVQHIDGIFASGMTEWLSEGTGIPVKLATPGARPEPGTALVAGSDGHLVLTRSGTFSYVDEPRNAIHRPSIDTFFQSLAQHWKGSGVGVLLTGMGRDGAAGLHELRSAGFRTIAQDEQTSVVFGMPKAAIQLGAAERTLPIGDVGPTVGRWLAGGR
jgi:two-component system, chemotaxis family, response regulator WspF